MFLFNKKIRRLAETLDKAEALNKAGATDGAKTDKLPGDLREAINAIKDAAPQEARAQFRHNLKQQLLLKHKTMPKAHSTQKADSSDEKASPHRGFPHKGWAFAVALLVLVMVSGLASYPLIPAPQVEGYALKENLREISYNAPIKVVFTQPMDHGSVEAAFHIEPAVQGDFEWSNNTMMFKPAEQLPVGKTYAVTVEKKAKSLFQKPMQYDYEENFEITGPPQILLFNPAVDSEFVDVGSKITVLFDRPMTALASLDKGETVFPAIKIDPPVTGRFKWLGTSSVTYIPDRLAYSTKYTVTIPKGTTSADGGSTDKDFTYSFSTPGPAIMQSIPYDMDPYNGPDSKVRIDFNQPMDPGKAKASLHFYKANAEASGPANTPGNGSTSSLLANFDATKWTEMPFSVRNMTAEDIKDEEGRVLPFSGEAPVVNPETDGTPPDQSVLEKSLVIVPDAKLSYKSVYFLKIDKGLVGKEGAISLVDDSGIVFRTVGDIEITGTTPANGADLNNNEYPYLGSVEIKFSHPMDIASFNDKVTVTPLKKDKDTGEELKPTISGGPDNASLMIGYSYEPSTSYTISLKGGGKDMFGQTMTNDRVFTFKTAPLKPTFNLESRSDLSILDINKTPVYYLKSTNVDSVHFNFRKLTKEEFNKIYSFGYLNYNMLTSMGGEFTSSWDQKPKGEFNKETITKIDLNADGNKLTPGIYYFDITSPQVIDEYQKKPVTQRQVFIITGTALAVKRSSDELLVWAHSLKDGSPVAGLNATVMDRAGKTVTSGKTDKDGLATLTLPKPANEGDYYSNDYTVSTEKDGDYTIVHTTWSEGIDPWNFDISYDPFQPDYYIYSYTDRPIYRPGHTVYFKGLVRKDVDASFKLPDVKKIHVSIKDSQYESVLEKDYDLNANGTYNGDYTLGDNVRTGNYTIETTVPGASGPEYLNKFYTYFRIAEYRKPDYELTLKADKENYVNGDKAAITVKGAYFFGAPLPNAPVEYTVRSQDYYFFLPSEGDSPYSSAWYSFSDDGYNCYWGCEAGSEVVTSGKGTLDANGEFTINLPLDISKKKISQIYTVEVTVKDLNNQSVSNRVSMPVNAGDYYLGILNQDYVVSKNDPVNFDVISVDYKGMPVANKSVEVSLYKRSWNTVKKKNVDSDFYYENSYEDLFVEKKSVTTDDKGHATVSFNAKEGGNFKATASAKDSRGNAILASTTVYVTSDSFLNWGRENNDMIELVPDKNEYKPGDTAKILIKSPYTDVWALVTQERQKVIDKQVIKLKTNSDTIEIPITDKSLPNVFVSVLLVKGDLSAAGLGEPALGANDERDVAAFKIGYATLQVNTSSKKLGINVETDQPKYHPADEMTIKVKTTDYTGKAVPAEVSLAIVDKSVLSLTDTVTADLLNAFYRKRWLGVFTAETLTKAISRVNVQVEAGLKGGGGATPAKRGVFKDTAYWQAEVTTDANGMGEVKFKLPDNLTTWQILAIGIDKNTLVGSEKAEFIVTKDVLVRAVLPRFLIVDDTLNAGGIVHNYLDKATDFDVSLDATGVDIVGSKTTRITLQPGEEKKVEWVVKVGSAKEAVFIFKALAATDQTIGDVLEQKLPIQPYSFPEVVATSGTISDNNKDVETVWLPVGVDPKFGELTLSVAPTLAGSIAQGLEYLMTFPYGCVEQTTSSLLPNVVVKQVIDLPALSNTLVDEKTLKKNVEGGVAALYKYQQGNGSWGVWQTSEPNPYLTAYVLYTLDQVQKAGYTVDENVIKRGRDYLTSYMNGNQITKPADTANPYDKSQYRQQVNLRAYIMFVLAETGKGDLALSNNLYDYRQDMNIFSKAYLAMAFNSIDKKASADKITQLKNDILNKAKETPRGVHFEETESLYMYFDTNGRTTAIVLQMLSRIDPGNPYIPKILRNMLMEKKDGRYQSTQETAITLIAMVDYLKNSKELEPSYNAVVTVDGAEKLNKSYTTKNAGDKDMIKVALTELLPDNQDNEVTFARTGVGNLYYDMNLKYYLPTEKIQPRDQGIVVTQEYFRTDDKKMETPVASAPAGENLKGKMTIIVPEDRYYVMVEDYLPAGLEGVDFSLNTSQMGLQDSNQPMGKGGYYGGKGYYDYGYWAFNYSEVRDDRMMFFADFLPKGVYEIEYYVRATTPGTYHDLPALAQELYFPEVFGRSGGKIFEVQAVTP
jgi:alpha-2-macroglobulin